eukprot:gene20097-26815_t
MNHEVICFDTDFSNGMISFLSLFTIMFKQMRDSGSGGAGLGALPARLGAEPILTLDEVRDYLAVGVRSCERFSTSLKAQLELLESRKPDEEWLELTKEEASVWADFKARVDGYYDSVRRMADQMALKEMSLNGDEGNGSGMEQEAQFSLSGYIRAQHTAQHSGDASGVEQNARFIHPELQRFKQEKQAK